MRRCPGYNRPIHHGSHRVCLNLVPLGCVHTPKDCACTCSIPSDKCVQRTCVQGSCVNTSICVTSPDPCFKYTGTCLDPINQGMRHVTVSFMSALTLLPLGCETQPVCDDKDPCTKDECSGGVCSSKPIDCDDGNACTTDGCRAGQCFHERVTCPDDKCSDVSCDEKLGCQSTPKVRQVVVLFPLMER